MTKASARGTKPANVTKGNVKKGSAVPANVTKENASRSGKPANDANANAKNVESGLIPAKAIASELGITARQFRAFLRTALGGFNDKKYTRYGFTDAQVDVLKKAYVEHAKEHPVKAKLTAAERKAHRKARAERRKAANLEAIAE